MPERITDPHLDHLRVIREEAVTASDLLTEIRDLLDPEKLAEAWKQKWWTDGVADHGDVAAEHGIDLTEDEFADFLAAAAEWIETEESE